MRRVDVVSSLWLFVMLGALAAVSGGFPPRLPADGGESWAELAQPPRAPGRVLPQRSLAASGPNPLAAGGSTAATPTRPSAAVSGTTLSDATGKQVPLRPYTRIASASGLADQLLLELAEPERIVALSQNGH